MRPFRVYFTPARLVAWRRLYYHLVAGFAGILLAVFTAHTGMDILPLLQLTWCVYRIPAVTYVLAFLQNAAKSAEEHADDKPAA